MSRRAWLVIAGIFVLVACDPELEMSSPEIGGAAEPHLVCNQLEPLTNVSIDGSGFSPLPVDTALEPAHLLLPTITLQRASDLQGDVVSDEPLVIPDDPMATETSLVHWRSQNRMTCRPSSV